MYVLTPRLVALITICIMRRRRVRADSRRLRLHLVSGKCPGGVSRPSGRVSGRCRAGVDNSVKNVRFARGVSKSRPNFSDRRGGQKFEHRACRQKRASMSTVLARIVDFWHPAPGGGREGPGEAPRKGSIRRFLSFGGRRRTQRQIMAIPREAV